MSITLRKSNFAGSINRFRKKKRIFSNNIEKTFQNSSKRKIPFREGEERGMKHWEKSLENLSITKEKRGKSVKKRSGTKVVRYRAMKTFDRAPFSRSFLPNKSPDPPAPRLLVP